MTDYEKVYDFMGLHFREAIYMGMNEKFYIEVGSRYSGMDGFHCCRLDGKKLTKPQTEYANALATGYLIAKRLSNQIALDGHPYKFEALKKELEQRESEELNGINSKDLKSLVAKSTVTGQ